ncbi:50S ribosomal protein L28 [Buchnera aphidicola]|uniref:50S ribosomal protein L28 n=1 Tax=Buchnera aphidicola TaxID=9 RepID=UPI0031B8A87F
MSKICIITKKKPLFGNNRSHAMNATKKKFLPNLHKKKFWIANKNKFIKLKISTKGIRIINKYGIEKIISKIKKK